VAGCTGPAGQRARDAGTASSVARDGNDGRSLPDAQQRRSADSPVRRRGGPDEARVRCVVNRASVEQRAPAAHHGDLAARNDELGSAAQTLLLLHEARGVLHAFDAAGVGVLILKGLAYLASFRLVADGRRMSDIDLLVRPADRDRAAGVLLAAGFRPDAPPPNALRLVERARQEIFTRTVAGVAIEVDLHWSLLNLDHGPFGFAIDHEQIWTRSVPASLDGQAARRLSDEDLLLHSCLHHAIHDAGGNRRDLLDIRSIVAQAPLDWAAVIERAHTWGVVASVWWALRRARQQVGAEVPSEALAALRPHGLFRLCAPLFDSRAQLPPDRRLKGELWIVRRVQARSAARVVPCMLRMVWPSDSWLAARYGDPKPGWVRRLKHMSRFAWHAGREISRLGRQ